MQNPFNDYGGGYGAGNSVPPAQKSAWNGAGDVPDEEVALGDSNGGGWSASGPSGGGGDKDVKKREKALAKREKDLAKREEELRRREEQLRAAGAAAAAEVKNWPRCYPLIHNDIATDIPSYFQRAVRAAWILFWMFVVASVFNWVGALVALCAIGTKDGRLPGMFLALIYLVVGVPLFFVLCYRTLYKSAVSDRALGFAWFFITFLAFFIFVVWSAVGPDILVSQWSHTGVLSAISAFDKNTVSGIFYIIGAALWVLTALMMLVVLKMVYMRFRGRDANASTMKEEMVQQMVARNMV